MDISQLFAQLCGHISGHLSSVCPRAPLRCKVSPKQTCFALLGKVGLTLFFYYWNWIRCRRGVTAPFHIFGQHTLAHQFCFPKLRNIENSAEDHYRHHIASHPPPSASAHCLITVCMGAADSIESEIRGEIIS